MVGAGKLAIAVNKDGRAGSPSTETGTDLVFEDEASEASDSAQHGSVQMLSVSWTPRTVHRAKGMRDDGAQGLSDAARGKLLLAIAKARRWMREVEQDATTLEDIARQEGCGVRHVRFLAPLAFASPAVIAAIHYGRVPADLTISSLARGLPKDWATQDAQKLS